MNLQIMLCLTLSVYKLSLQFMWSNKITIIYYIGGTCSLIHAGTYRSKNKRRKPTLKLCKNCEWNVVIISKKLATRLGIK